MDLAICYDTSGEVSLSVGAELAAILKQMSAECKLPELAFALLLPGTRIINHLYTNAIIAIVFTTILMWQLCKGSLEKSHI